MTHPPLAVHVGFDDEGHRDLFLLAVERSDQVAGAALALGSPYFASLLTWDTTACSADEVMRVARVLLDAGCVYFCCWGPGCERTHDLVDEEYLQDGVSVVEEESAIMTSWHDGDSLEQSAWFALNCAFPDDRFFKGCKAVLAVCIGNKVWADQLAAAFKDPKSLSSKGVAVGHNAA